MRLAMSSLARTETKFLRLKWLAAARRVEISFAKFAILGRKAGFNPDQPRDERGRWNGGGNRPGIGHNQGPSLEDPPEIPETQPVNRRAVNDFLKAAARWLARALGVGAAVEAGAFIAAYQALSWLDTDRILIEAYQDPPKTLGELQEAVSDPKWGYDVHHIVEQTPAAQAKFSRDQIDASDNLARIPTLKHWEITGWYARRNFDPPYNGLSPRSYLQDKGWVERSRVGRDALVKFKVLEP
jgi:hypothetical protein